MNLVEATRTLTHTPTVRRAPDPGPRPEPGDRLVRARQREPLVRTAKIARNLALGAGSVLLSGTAGKVCGALVGAMGVGGTLGGIAGLALSLPLMILGVHRDQPALMYAGIGVMLAGALAGAATGGYLGWQMGGEGLGLGSGILAAGALLMNSASRALPRLEKQHQESVQEWERQRQAFVKGETAPEEPPPPLEIPSAIQELGDLVLVGGIRLPQRQSPNRTKPAQ